jgi:hypothetical protein
MRIIPHKVRVGVSTHVGMSGVGRGTRNIRIGRIASSIVSTHPVIVGSGPVQSGVRISGNVCADRRKL